MLRSPFVVLLKTLSVALVVAAPIGLARAAGSQTIFVSFGAKLPGAAGSGIQIQNLDPSLEARISAAFFPLTGGAPINLDRPGVRARTAANIYLPGESALANGGYAAIVSADRPLAAIARTDWYGGGAAIVGDVVASKHIALPGIFKRFNLRDRESFIPHSFQSSIVLVQNTDPRQRAPVTVFLRGPDGGLLAQAMRFIGPGASIALDLRMDPAFTAVPDGSAGTLLIESATVPVAAQHFVIDDGFPRAVYAHEGVSVEMAAPRLYAPLLRNEFYGTSSIAVFNPGSRAADVAIRYLPSPLTPACVGESLHGGRRFTLAAGGSAVFDQGNTGLQSTGDSDLPPRCLAGAIIESSDGKLLATVVDHNLWGGGTAASYRAFSDADGAKKVALPLFRNKHTNLDLSTGIQVMNIGTATANIALEFPTARGALIELKTSAAVAPLGSHTWFPPTIPGMPANVYGAVFVTSDQPIVVIVNDASGNGKADSAIYSGIKAD